ncbi:acyl-CoA synthetase [Microbacterium fluvii]|uniref:Acyl-CoA synthetase n=1 Tax=Microbacterium fluvii TaxID=415215 RepID=A0ABW2HCI4_9MICO|nr:acyl-CoA synthetase [Microbacterium fluvii]MCU4672671.1 acyl-CoA synthetase [Microbacterium fluvii]
MTASPTPRTFEVRHVQLVRALFAALAAVMITFSTDHSAAVGLAVFSGFAIATALVHLVSVWLVFPADHRWPSVVLGILCLLAGMAGGIPALRNDTLFFVLVIVWALATGLVETIVGWRARAESRDTFVVGVITLALGVAMLFVSPQFSLAYAVEGHDFTLTGTTIGVGVFGAYAAIIAVYLGIAGFSPRKEVSA